MNYEPENQYIHHLSLNLFIALAALPFSCQQYLTETDF